MKSQTGVIGILLLLVFCGVSRATTYHVGAQRDVKTLSAISARLLPGDVVEIDPGIYHEVLKLRANGIAEAPIIIRGTDATRHIFDAQGVNISGRGPIPRAIWQSGMMNQKYFS